MSVEEKTLQIQSQIRNVINEAFKIQQLTNVVLLKIEDVELPKEFKQQLLVKYSSLKATLKTAVDALP